MLFFLANTFDFFEYFMKDVFQSYFDIFAIVYINDILVYCNLLLKYKKHVKLVLN